MIFLSAVTVPPRVTRKVSRRTTPKVKITSEGESVQKALEKGSEKLEQDEKVSVESESKTLDVDEEKEDDKTTELSEKKAGEEIKPTPSMVKGNFSQEKKNSSSPVNNTSESQDAGELKPTTRSTTLMSKDVPKEGEDEKENTAKEVETDDEEIANQQSKRDVSDTEEKEFKETGEVNDDDKNEDDDVDGDETLDDKEKVQESMDLPVGDKIPLLPLPQKAHQRAEGRLQIPDEVKKLQDSIVSIKCTSAFTWPLDLRIA